MCVVSFIHDWGKQQPFDKWTQPGWDSYKELIEVAKKVDIVLEQPDCQDPEKLRWTEAIEKRLQDKAKDALVETAKRVIETISETNIAVPRELVDLIDSLHLAVRAVDPTF